VTVLVIVPHITDQFEELMVNW